VRELAYAFGLVPRPAPTLDGLPDAADVPVDGATPTDDDPVAADREASDAAGAASGPVPIRPADGGATAEPAGPTSRPVSGPSPVRDRNLAEWLALAAARHEAAVRAGLAGARQAILDGVWTDGELRDVLDLGALIGVRDVRGTGLAHRPHVAVVDKLRGSLVALTDADGIRRGQALGPPPETDGYTPGADLDRFVRLRDRRCRFPGCRARARSCDLDHRREWPQGPTAHHNVCCLCEHHHRLKHQAPGWHVDEADDGGLAFAMPSGEVLVSHPPRFGTDLDVPPY
jgi:hypothetical protein